jgi:hypothetical protein
MKFFRNTKGKSTERGYERKRIEFMVKYTQDKLINNTIKWFRHALR